MPPYETSIEGCPDWVTLIPDQRILAGSAPVAESRNTFFCTFRVTESDPGFRPARSVSYGLRLVVTAAATLPLTLPLPRKISLRARTFYSAAFPAATGGVQPYVYSFTCAGGMLPSGMGFAPETVTFAGTPDTPFRDSCTYTVTDSSRPAATVSRAVEVEVTAAATPPLTLPLPRKISLRAGTFYSAAFPAATGGVQPYVYSFTCAGGMLPSGMGFAPETVTFAGTPDTPFRDSCTYTVTDSSRPAATVSRAVEVEVTAAATPPLTLPLPRKISLRAGTFYSAAFPAATGGVQPYVYSFTCAGGMLPSGMGFAPETVTFAGTPDTPFRDSCTYTVTDSSRPAATVSRAVEVEVTATATQPLTLTQIFVEEIPGDELMLRIGRRSQTKFQAASGGVARYTYELADCMLAAGLEFHSSTRVLSGTPTAEYRGPNCTYRVTDSSSPPVSISRSFALIVEPLETGGGWRFRTRTVDPGQGLCVLPGSRPIGVATMPRAHRRRDLDDLGTYEMPGTSEPGSLLSFDSNTRVLTFTNPATSPLLGTPNTYRYLVRADNATNADDAAAADDALCVDVQYDSGENVCREDDTVDPPIRPDQHIHIKLQVRDDAFWNGAEYRCPDTIAPTPRPSGQGVSNPVHEALGPVHARRATAVAHAAVRERVRRWSPGSEQASFAVVPEVGVASLTGQRDGFDYDGDSQSATFGAETGAGAWQAGLVASFTDTELRYQAAATLAELGYRAGEHDTEILSLHPFAAWHAPSGGYLWGSLGAGTGRLRHRDDLGFPSWSGSDVRLFAHAVGASVPLAEVFSGELQAEAGIESFAFDVEGGQRISSSLSTMRGLDYRAGLAWSAPVRGSPSVSLAYKHATGDGPEGGQLEARGSVSVEGIFHPRLALTGNAEGSFGLGDYEHDYWRVGGGVRFAPDSDGRGLRLDIDTRLVSIDDGESSDMGIRSEVGYGLKGGPFLGTMRPYVGLIRRVGDGSVQRTLGLDLGNRSVWRIKIEVHDDSDDQSPALNLSLRHRF